MHIWPDYEDPYQIQNRLRLSVEFVFEEIFSK
jgi:hypothetical protein